MRHAVARLRQTRLERSRKPFLARGSNAPRCPDCRVPQSHCLCQWRPRIGTQAGMCLIMFDIEPLKPSNTGWLIADVVSRTFAFGWARTEVDPELLALLADPQWDPYLVFPGEFAPPERVVTQTRTVAGKRPLFVLLDATWPEATKMFRKSPYLQHLPVLSLQPDRLSRYALRRSCRDEHFCTAEVASLCLELAGEPQAANVLDTYLDVFSSHYLRAKRCLPPEFLSAGHQRLLALEALGPLSKETT
jgi:DTW domain-containing protein